MHSPVWVVGVGVEDAAFGALENRRASDIVGLGGEVSLRKVKLRFFSKNDGISRQHLYSHTSNEKYSTRERSTHPPKDPWQVIFNHEFASRMNFLSGGVVLFIDNLPRTQMWKHRIRILVEMSGKKKK